MSRTVLIGLDGATFSILDPLMETGVMPFLRNLVAEGARGELLSSANPQTAQAWPCMTTGRSAGNTGIFDFVRFEARKDGPYLTVTDSRDLCAETIWSIASRNQRTVTTLNFYGMHPPTPIAGYSVSGFIPFRHLKGAVYPPGLYDRIKALPGFNAKELAMDLDLEKKCINGLPPEEYESWISLHIRREQQWFELLRSLMTADPTDLTAIVFDGVDKLQHLCWRFIDPRLFPASPTAWESRVRSLCLDYFRQLDGFIREIVDMAGKDSRTFLASDHGFGASTEIFYVNAWLHDHGYLRWTDDHSRDAGESLIVSRLKNHLQLLDWEKTSAYAVTPSSNGIFIQRAGKNGAGGVRPEEYEAFRRRLIDSLLAFQDPETGEPVVTRVRTREEAYPGAWTHLAPDLLLTLRDGGFVSILNSDCHLKPRSEPVGTHREAGIFIACGHGIESGARLDRLSILDVAPAVLFSLDVPIPEDFEGRLPESVFAPSLLAAQPPRSEQAALRAMAAAQAQGAAAPMDDGLAEEAILDQLKALGYLE